MSAIEKPFLGVVSVAQLAKTPDAAVLAAVAALVRACTAWARPQAKALSYKFYFETYPLSNKEPNIAPIHCAAVYNTARIGLIFMAVAIAMETAGFM